MSETTLLIDGDHALYVACAAVEREVRWDEENHVLFSNREEALSAFDHIIQGKMEALGSEKVWLAFSGSNNFRKKVSPTYKAKRAERKPLCYSGAMEEIWKRYKCAKVDGLEGDDLMGIWQTRNGDETIIVSEDKDMRGVPGKLYNREGLVTITEDQADYFWLLQTLTGDPTDGYPGLPGCGPVKAAKVLHAGADEQGGIPLETLWSRVVEAYKKAGLDEGDALIQARLARILRASDWDSKRKEMKLWTPPSR